MLDSAHYRELRNGKRYTVQREREVSENESVEENRIGSSS